MAVSVNYWCNEHYEAASWTCRPRQQASSGICTERCKSARLWNYTSERSAIFTVLFTQWLSAIVSYQACEVVGHEVIMQNNSAGMCEDFIAREWAIPGAWMTDRLITSFLPERHYVTFGSLLSQFRLSVVCNVGAPYSGGWSFRQYFFTAVYAGHPLTSVQNFPEIVLGEPLRRERWTQEGYQNRAILDLSKTISHKRYKIDV